MDLRLVRNQWLLIDPNVEFLMSASNEDRTSEDFREMGTRLAQEVVNFVKKKIIKFSKSHKHWQKAKFLCPAASRVIIRGGHIQLPEHACRVSRYGKNWQWGSYAGSLRKWLNPCVHASAVVTA